VYIYMSVSVSVCARADGKDHMYKLLMKNKVDCLPATNVEKREGI
jgi:hypothetical protein